MNSYEKFIQANNALSECYKQTEPTAYETMTPFEKESLCQDERKLVAEFILDGSLSFRNLVSERIDILSHHHE